MPALHNRKLLSPDAVMGEGHRVHPIGVTLERLHQFPLAASAPSIKMSGLAHFRGHPCHGKTPPPPTPWACEVKPSKIQSSPQGCLVLCLGTGFDREL